MKYYCFILLFVVLSCTKKKNDRGDEGFQRERQKVIVIQPLGNFKLNQAEKVFRQIRTLNPDVVLKQNIPFSEKSFYKP